jgi:hypothetical protein
MNGERVTLGLVAICALALVAVLVTDRPAGAKRVPSVLQARTIELVDGRGQVRAQLKVERNREAKDTSLSLQRGEERTTLVP